MEIRRRPSGRTLLAGLLIAGGLFYYLGDLRRAVPAATGTSLQGMVTTSGVSRSTLRVATFNIHGGTGRDLHRDLNRTADALAGFDLVWLNEVHGPYFWQVAGQAEELARLTGRHWLFAPTEERWWHHQFGNALLSAQDVTWWQRLPLPSPSRGYRNLVLMELKHANQPIHVIATHLDRNDSTARSEQLHVASKLFLALAPPVILMGDLNTTADESPLAALLAREGVHDPLHDILRGQTPRRIDWILTRGLKTIDAGMIDNGASDHPLVWAELEGSGLTGGFRVQGSGFSDAQAEASDEQ